MVVVGRGGIPPAPGCDRRLPRRAGAGARRRGRTVTPRPAGARPRPRGRPSRARSGRRPARARVLDERRPRGRPRGVRRGHGAVCSKPGTSPTSSAAPSPWPTSGSPKAVSATRCARTSRRCSSRRRTGAPVLRGTADMYVGMSEIHRERNDLDARPAAPAAEPGARRAHRVAAEPVSLAGRDGSDARGRGRSGRRARPARRGRAPVRGRLLSQRAPGPGDEGRCWIAQGKLGEAARLGA